MPDLLILIFLFLLGACVGSFLNVVVWRLPRGESLNHPGSHCPKCNRPLLWHDNIPILGWIKLYGRCRFCGKRISSRYPIVEALTAVLFASYYAAIYMSPASYRLGPCVQTYMTSGTVHERFGRGLAGNWPIFLLYLYLLSGLLAASLIDAELFIIPTSIIWGWRGGVAVVAIAIHLIWDTPTLPGNVMTGGLGGAIALGGGLGLLASVLLLRLGKLPLSFADGGPLLEVEKERAAKMAGESSAAGEKVLEAAAASSGESTVAESAVKDLIIPEEEMVGAARDAEAAGANLAEDVAASPVPAAAREEEPREYTAAEVRAEIRKEMLFLMLPLAGALLAVWLTWSGGHFHRQWEAAMQVRWVSVLLGSGFGVMAGGFVVWLTRIFGSLVFGREAMGMGDVDLMAGVGAALGAGPAVTAFFLAPFFGILVAVYMVITGSRRELPYGPYLSLGTAFVMLWYCQVAGYFAPGVLGLVSLVHGMR